MVQERGLHGSKVQKKKKGEEWRLQGPDRERKCGQTRDGKVKFVSCAEVRREECLEVHRGRRCQRALVASWSSEVRGLDR